MSAQPATGKVYRLVVDKWPTDDGQPFTDQDPEFWERIIECRNLSNHQGHSECVCPEWLPDDLTAYIGFDPPSFTHWLGDNGDPHIGDPGYTLIWLPFAPTRRFFTRTRLEAAAKQLRAWGCTAHVEFAYVGEWEPARIPLNHLCACGHALWLHTTHCIARNPISRYKTTPCTCRNTLKDIT